MPLPPEPALHLLHHTAGACRGGGGVAAGWGLAGVLVGALVIEVAVYLQWQSSLRTLLAQQVGGRTEQMH